MKIWRLIFFEQIFKKIYLYIYINIVFVDIFHNPKKLPPNPKQKEKQKFNNLKKIEEKKKKKTWFWQKKVAHNMAALDGFSNLVIWSSTRTLHATPFQTPLTLI